MAVNMRICDTEPLYECIVRKNMDYMLVRLIKYHTYIFTSRPHNLRGREGEGLESVNMITSTKSTWVLVLYGRDWLGQILLDSPLHPPSARNLIFCLSMAERSVPLAISYIPVNEEKILLFPTRFNKGSSQTIIRR